MLKNVKVTRPWIKQKMLLFSSLQNTFPKLRSLFQRKFLCKSFICNVSVIFYEYIPRLRLSILIIYLTKNFDILLLQILMNVPTAVITVMTMHHVIIPQEVSVVHATLVTLELEPTAQVHLFMKITKS